MLWPKKDSFPPMVLKIQLCLGWEGLLGLPIWSLSINNDYGYKNVTYSKKWTCTYSILFNSSNVDKFVWCWIPNGCIKVREKNKKVVVLCSHPQQNVNSGTFTYCLTSPYSHLYNTNTSLLLTVCLVPEKPKSYIPYLCSTDTSVKQTLGSVPLVSVLKRFDCIVVVQQQLRNVQKSMMHVQSCCFANPKLHCLFAILVAVAVVIA